MANECPKCEYMIQWKAFRAECEAEIAKKSPGPAADKRWPLNIVLSDLNTVTHLDTMVRGKGHNPNWSVVTVALVSIYRDELNKSKAEDDWNREQEYKTRSGAPRSRARDEDYD